MGLLDDYAQLLTNERQKEKIRGLLGIADTVTGADQIRGIPADPRNWTIDDTAKMLNFAGGGIGAIKAYHGSPHKFDAFDMSKIGTGEGAQAYGHGLYFAENPDVAKQYAENVQLPKSFTHDDYKSLVQYKRQQRLGNELSKDDKAAFDDLMARKLQYEDAVNSQNNLYNVSLEWPDAAREAADPLGPQHFLDWDKPLSQQPDSVKNAWGNLFGGLPAPQGSLGRTLKGLMAEDDLKAEGIPGIRYLDGGSRGAGDGSYNYVVFDDQIPRILERNGKPLKGLLDK